MKTKEEIEVFRAFAEDNLNHPFWSKLPPDQKRKQRIFFMQASRILGWVLDLDKDNPIFSVEHSNACTDIICGQTLYSYKPWPEDDTEPL